MIFAPALLLASISNPRSLMFTFAVFLSEIHPFWKTQASQYPHLTRALWSESQYSWVFLSQMSTLRSDWDILVQLIVNVNFKFKVQFITVEDKSLRWTGCLFWILLPHSQIWCRYLWRTHFSQLWTHKRSMASFQSQAWNNFYNYINWNISFPAMWISISSSS